MSNRRRLEAADVKRAANLLEVVARYVELRRKGDGIWVGACPFHEEKTPSFQVRERRQHWHCFGCNEGGDVIDFVMKAERLRLPEALERLGAMDLQPAPFALWETRKSHVLPCEGKGCGERLVVNLEDIAFLGLALHRSWIFKGRGESIRGLCPACVRRWPVSETERVEAAGLTTPGAVQAQPSGEPQTRPLIPVSRVPSRSNELGAGRAPVPPSATDGPRRPVTISRLTNSP